MKMLIGRKCTFRYPIRREDLTGVGMLVDVQFCSTEAGGRWRFLVLDKTGALAQLDHDDLDIEGVA